MIGNPLLLGPEGYQISRSVRLRSSASANFTRTPSVSGNMKTWTWSAWVKRGSLSQTGTIWGSNFASGGFGMAFGNYGGAGVNPEIIGVTLYAVGTVTTSAVFRDPSAWYHIVARFDSTQATQANRFRLYVNNVQQTLSGTLNVTLNADYHVNASSRLHTLGGESGYFNDCYLTEVNHIDGQSLDPSSFGETDVLTGVWKPKKYAGTYGTNGFYLTFSDNSAATAAALGKDTSGNGNNWTPNNISVTAGSTYDSMLDVPTLWADGGNGRGNYAVLNPLIRQAAASSNLIAANLEQNTTLTGGEVYALSTMPLPATGKFYAEFSIVAASGLNTANSEIGLVSGPRTSGDNSGRLDQCPSSTVYRADGNRQIDGGTASSYGATWGNGDTIGIAVDMDAASVTFYKNNTSQGAITSLDTQDVFMGVCLRVSGGTGYAYANFGQRPFAYTPPAGFKALNTQNLPEPTIKKGSDWFSVALDTGANIKTTAEALFTGDDLVWIKDRANANNHQLIDTVRGSTAVLQSNTTAAETTYSAPTGNSVAWAWKESATAGFDIVTYTGTGANRTVAHSLGVAPKMMFVKNRSTNSPENTNWRVYHETLGNTGGLFLNTTGSFGANSTFWNNTSPTSSVFSLGTDIGVNNSGITYVAYLFSEVAGFSKFGSYTGNGSADGPFVFTGFRPRWVMVKKTSSTGSWAILDSARDPFNQGNKSLYPDLSNAEVTIYDFRDFLANGFKIRTTDQNSNGNGDTYVYAAFAENPFRNSLAR